ncbi:MAG: hypothetical protein E7Z81_01235 [Methanobrevibacter sp.]|uniref:hypothetical protein n=1 Tax=Methanobrevibacter sp. TaxID=66852 RepID=UPI002600149D|nr:hypothetical protein [Methanobrevibacter sp.]MBE6496898.1 hypothetical protein [Methanobrevibacter sp.]
MPFFIDTNIALGYSIIHDRIHESSKRLIHESKEDIFWSNLVQEEYTEKFDEILDEIEIFLKSAEKILETNEKDFINYYSFEKYVLNRTKNCNLDTIKKQKILNHYWEKYQFIYGISNLLYLNFKNHNKNFKKMYLLRDKNLNRTLLLHDCGPDNYLKYLNYAKQLYMWGIHKPDCKIIADAHDCGTAHDNLTFVSADIKMIDIITAHKTNFLNIAEFKSCS